MSNFPDGVTQRMIDRHFGGPEDEGDEILIRDGDLLLLVYASEGILAIQVFNCQSNIMQEEYFLDLSEARELADAISKRVL